MLQREILSGPSEDSSGKDLIAALTLVGDTRTAAKRAENAGSHDVLQSEDVSPGQPSGSLKSLVLEIILNLKLPSSILIVIAEDKCCAGSRHFLGHCRSD